MTENFMASDLIRTSGAFLLLALFICIPGYVFGWLLDVLGFRRRSRLARFAISIPFSIAVCPIVTYLLWRWSPVAVWTLYGSCWMGFLVLLWQDRRMWLAKPAASGTVWAVLAIIVGWVFLGLFCLVDLQIRYRLYFPTVAYDYSLRTAVTSAITRTGAPPDNPFFFPGRHFVMRYHYFWFMLCSLADQLGGALISPRQAMLAGTLWCGIGLMALIPLYLRFFQPKGSVELEKRMLLGVALLSVTGLDIIPVALITLLTRRILANIEGWNTPVMAWAHAFLWVPHHVAGLIACLIGFLVIWCAARADGAGRRLLAAVIAGFTFASAAGLSVFITLVFAVFLAVWLGITLLKKHHRQAGMISISAIVALAVATPYLMELLGGAAGPGGSGGAFLQFTVRPFRLAEAFVQTSWPDQPWLVPVVNFLFLPLNYFLELGFFFLVALSIRRRWRHGTGSFNQEELCGFTMAATSLLICTFLRSSVISNNDLGWRGILVAQFILLIWGAELLNEGLLASFRNRRAVVAALLALGVAGTLYEVCMVRFYPVLSDDFEIPRSQWLSADRHLGTRTYALREAYERLKNILPERAVVQHNPNVIPNDLFYGLYADRQAAADTLTCGVVFGGDSALCSGIIGPINDLFEKPGVIGAEEIDAMCGELSIDALVVKDTDRVWADKNSWVWKKQPVIANDYVRAFLCGKNLR
jgi:hypothetical protein